MQSQEFDAIQLDTLMRLGIHSYLVDIGNGLILYRTVVGEIRIHSLNEYHVQKMVAQKADHELLDMTIIQNRAGQIDRKYFWNKLADAGVRYYDVVLCGKVPMATFVTANGIRSVPLQCHEV